jgi:8-oxo-dGTP pyrophosphatase MutT (NUDIX family)
LISPSNEILLLHRVRTSSSFPSAHVFPGGNLSASQDGEIPSSSDPKRHIDGPAYRLGAIRECFEESGILLAKRKGSDQLLEVPEEEREKARKDIHAGKVKFPEWVELQGGIVDCGKMLFGQLRERKL